MQSSSSALREAMNVRYTDDPSHPPTWNTGSREASEIVRQRENIARARLDRFWPRMAKNTIASRSGTPARRRVNILPVLYRYRCVPYGFRPPRSLFRFCRYRYSTGKVPARFAALSCASGWWARLVATAVLRQRGLSLDDESDGGQRGGERNIRYDAGPQRLLFQPWQLYTGRARASLERLMPSLRRGSGSGCLPSTGHAI